MSLLITVMTLHAGVDGSRYFGRIRNAAASDMSDPVVQGRALKRQGRVPEMNHRAGD
jgi:hypothetical protein